jgi:hypothetical protein
MGDLIQKAVKAKTGAVAQVVEHLFSKCKALSSNPILTKSKTTTTKKPKPCKNPRFVLENS